MKRSTKKYTYSRERGAFQDVQGLVHATTISRQTRVRVLCGQTFRYNTFREKMIDDAAMPIVTCMQCISRDDD